MQNKVFLIGNLGQDPDVNTTNSGNTVCNLSVATSRVWYDKENEKHEETEWHRVTVFGKQADSCKSYLKKGSKVSIEGRLQTRKWDDKDGNTRYTTEIVTERVIFLTPKGEGGGGSGGGRRDTPPPPTDDDLPF